MEDMSTNNQAFMDAHKQLSLAIKYPPFSTSITKRNKYRDELLAEELKMNREGLESNDRPFAKFKVTWQDDIDESMLYMKRYGDDYSDAKDAALKAENKSPDDNDVPLDF